eukprot:CAMPEP_0113464796 /NCGR_PEP_ID=MMETSP0014_2-20120614/13389_1 /TAXON_ID=2857 /ORGANISM="Nitzschia sp." /LENGTH=843 /DNA_ID=CAMNT_0000356895 /DNA_START=70 /DNA_END=2601 /DNA_ORIENTATION=- /assembly_acc=CAM_ASM_000159
MGLQPLAYINNKSNVHKTNSSSNSSNNVHKTRNYQRQSSPLSSCLFLGASLLNNCCILVSASQTAVAATAGETVSSWFQHEINIYIDIDDKTTRWWFFMASSLILTIFVSWWILGTAFSSSGSSVGPAGRFNFNKNSFVRSSFGGSSLQSSNSQQKAEQDLDKTSSLSASGRKSKKSRNNKDGNDKNKDEKAAASAVSSSFDYFFNANNNANSSVLKDLEPPFAMLDEYNVHPDELTAVVPQPDVTHFCFLVHGHRGLSKDLAYFQTVMQREATIEKKRNGLLPETVVENDDDNVDGDGDDDDAQSMEDSTTDENVHDNNKGTADDVVMTEKQEEDNRPQQPQNADTHERNKRHDMVVYSSVANEGKTTDGIENGGDRLVEEMRTVIDAEMKKRYPEIVGNEIMEDNTGLPAASASENEEEDRIYDVTISMLGNSLGGLFGRYAIAKLVERHCVKEVRTIKVKGVENDIFSSVRAKIKKHSLNGNGGGGDDNDDEVLEEECWILDGKYRLHLNIFCTTASPHLGVSGHTWFRIPRTAEIGVAHAMGNTGKDLFRLNDLLYKMATDPVFLRPLGAFRKRIAYANCYGTDFVVPAGTAAFLSENSTYPHHFSDDYILDDNGLVIAALHTPTHVGENDEETEDHSDELHEMSSSLDKLGWKKVFVDVRKEMPSVEIPKVLRRSGTPSSETSSDNGDHGAAEGSNNEEAAAATAAATTVTNKVEQLKKQKVVGSKDIADAVSSFVDNRVSLPLGHNMIVAFSRNRVFTYANKAGRPIVDSLAKELVEDVFKWDDIYDGPVLSTKRQQPSSPTSCSPSSSTSSTKMSRRVSDVATSSMMVTEESVGES